MFIWIAFGILILGLLALDLGVFNKKAHIPSTREAFGWTMVWVSFSLLFSVFIFLLLKIIGLRTLMNYLERKPC